MNYQRILIILLIIFALWYLFFRRYEYLTVARARRTPRVARIRGRKHHIFGRDSKGRVGRVSSPPTSTNKINCAKIKCPDDFDPEIVCWECHGTR